MYENMRVHGIAARIYSIGDTYDETYDFYSDIAHQQDSYDEEIETWVTYEEVPSIKTLRSLGWYVENEDFPVIAYIPVLYYTKHCSDASSFKPKVDDKIILVANPIDDNPSTREFLIKDFKGNGFPNTIYYTCKLVVNRSELL